MIYANIKPEKLLAITFSKENNLNRIVNFYSLKKYDELIFGFHNDYKMLAEAKNITLIIAYKLHYNNRSFTIKYTPSGTSFL